MARVFIRVFNSKKTYYIKTTEHYLVDLHNRIEDFYHLRQSTPDLWDKHISTGKSIEIITDSQFVDTITEILGL